MVVLQYKFTVIYLVLKVVWFQVSLSFSVLNALFCCYEVTSGFFTQLGNSGWKPSLVVGS